MIRYDHSVCGRGEVCVCVWRLTAQQFEQYFNSSNGASSGSSSGSSSSSVAVTTVTVLDAVDQQPLVVSPRLQLEQESAHEGRRDSCEGGDHTQSREGRGYVLLLPLLLLGIHHICWE